jgi:hypothetical protein
MNADGHSRTSEKFRIRIGWTGNAAFRPCARAATAAYLASAGSRGVAGVTPPIDGGIPALRAWPP